MRFCNSIRELKDISDDLFYRPGRAICTQVSPHRVMLEVIQSTADEKVPASAVYGDAEDVFSLYLTVDDWNWWGRKTYMFSFVRIDDGGFNIHKLILHQLAPRSFCLLVTATPCFVNYAVVFSSICTCFHVHLVFATLQINHYE